MAAAVPIIGIGLSAAGTVAQMSQQQKQADAQRAAINAQMMSAENALKIRKQHLDYTKKYAQILKDRENGVLDMQYELQLQQIKANELQQEQERMAMQMQAAAEGSAATQQAESILQQAAAVRAQSAQANQELTDEYSANQDKAKDVYNRTYTLPAGGTREQIQQDILSEGIDQYQRWLGNLSRNSQLAENYTRNAQASAESVRQLGKLGVDYLLGTAQNQAKLYELGSQLQRKTLPMELQRQKYAAEAEYETTGASADMAYMSAALTNRAQQAALAAQKASIPKPGILSYLNLASGMLSQAAPLFVRPAAQSQTPSPNVIEWGQPLPKGL